MHKGCGFDPQSGHIQEATNEYINNWNNKPMFLFLKSALKFSNLNIAAWMEKKP